MQFFKLEEIVDKKTFDQFGLSCWQLFDLQALDMLDNFREFMGVPVTCNNWNTVHVGEVFQFRGYRPAWCSIGAKGSPHKAGKGFDVDVKDMSAEEVRQKVLANQDHPLLKLINRIEAEVNWFHMDRFEPPKGKNRIYLFHP